MENSISTVPRNMFFALNLISSLGVSELVREYCLDTVPSPSPPSEAVQLLSHFPAPTPTFFDCGLEEVKVGSTGQVWNQLTWYRLALIIWN